MTTILAWSLVITGIAHLIFGLMKFRLQLFTAFSAGVVNQFKELDAYAAFWFLMSGPPLVLSGHIAIHAEAINDLYSLRIIGIYTLISSTIGIVAFPKSPFWLPATLAILLIAVSYGIISP